MGLGTIGSKIVLEGEQEYKQALKNIKTEQQELRSEMKLAAEQFADSQNSVDALQKKYEILSKQYEEQAKKVEIYSDALVKSKEAQEESEKKVESYTEQLDQAKKSLKAMEESSDTASEAMEEQKQIVEDLQKKLTLAEQEYDKTSQKTSQYQTSLNYANAEMIKLDGELQKTSNYMEEAKMATDGCATSIDKYGKSTTEATEESEKFGEKSSKAINELSDVLVTAGITASIKEISDELMDCSEKAAEFEVAVAKVSTIADTSAMSMSDIKSSILATSTELKQGASAISDATYNAISASVETENAVKFASDATKLAVGGFTDATTAVDVLTTTLNAYNLETEQSMNIADMLVTTQNLGKTTVAELAASYGKVIPIAAAYNVQMDNLSASTAILTANGIATAESITYQKAMLNELGKSSTTVAKTLREQTGQSFADLMKSGKSLGDVIQILGDSVGGNKTKFNELWSSAEAGVGALSLLGSGASKFNEVLAAMDSSAGATETAFQTMANTADMAKQGMLNSIDNLQIAIGDKLNGSLVELYETGEDAFGWATDFIEENPEVIQAIEALTIGLGAFTIGVTAAKVGMIAFNAVLNTNPIVLATTAVISLTTALAAYTLVSEDSEASIDKETEARKRNIEALQQNYDTLKASQTSRDAEIGSVRSLEQQLFKLNSTEKLTNAQKAQMRDLVGQLNTALPDLNLQLSEQNGHLEQSNVETAKLIEASLKLYEVQAAQEDLTEISEKRWEAHKELNAALEEQEAITKELAAAEAELAPLTEQVTEDTKDLAAGQMYCNDEYNNAAREVENLKSKLEESTATVDAAQSVYDGFGEEFQKTTEYIENNSEAVEDNSEIVTESQEKVRAAFEESRAAVEETIKSQVGLFDELSGKSDLTAEQMTKNLKSQTDVYTQYVNDLVVASEIMKADTTGDFKEILDGILAMDMDGAGYLHELIDAYEDGGTRLQKVLDQFSEMENARELLAGAMTSIQDGYQEGLDAVIESQAEKHETFKAATDSLMEGIKESTKATGEQVVSDTDDSMNLVTETITNDSVNTNTAIQNMCTDMIATVNREFGIVNGESSVWKNVGKTIVTSTANGISANGSEVSKAMNTVIQNAINNMDVSGIASKIDRMLGERLG